MKGVAIVDYGMGNLRSVATALSALRVEASVASAPEDLRAARAILLPGVGAFPLAMQNLKRSGMADALTEAVIKEGKPFFGICLGMQLVAESSEELAAEAPCAGLAWLPGRVVALDGGKGGEAKSQKDLRVPHVGWNEVEFQKSDPMFRNLEPGAHFYFDHSFRLECPPEYVAAWCEYGGRVTAAIRRDNVFAAQFHPEKSQTAGLRLLRNFLNFAEIRPC